VFIFSVKILFFAGDNLQQLAIFSEEERRFKNPSLAYEPLHVSTAFKLKNRRNFSTIGAAKYKIFAKKKAGGLFPMLTS
jgi:hypothetical protein